MFSPNKKLDTQLFTFSSCAEDMELTKISPSQTVNRLRNKIKSPFCLFEVFQFCNDAIRRAQL